MLEIQTLLSYFVFATVKLSAVPVSTSLYGTTQLPCSSSFIWEPEKCTLVWKKKEEHGPTLYIHSIMKGREHHLVQNSRYKGRTELSKDFPRGDLSLTLREVTFADVGTYFCQAACDWDAVARTVELSLSGLHVQSQEGTLSDVSGKKRLTCVTIGMFRNPLVRWYDMKNTNLTAYESHHITERADGMKMVESVLNYDDQTNEGYLCRVTEGTLHTSLRIVRSDGKVSVKVQDPTSGPPG